MPQNRKPPFKTTHHFAYSLALALLAVGVFVAAITYLLFFDQSLTESESAFIWLGSIWVPMHFATQWAVAQKINGYRLSEVWQERLTQAIPAGLIVASIVREKTETLWANVSQLIGGWVIIALVLVATSIAIDWLRDRFVAYRNQRRS